MRGAVIGLGLALAGATSAHAQDVAAGEKVFQQCKVCHQAGPTAKNAVGPVLNQIIGRHSGKVEGYNYSAANKNSGIVWTEENFRKYIHDPKAMIPGTKMAFPGLKDETQINNLVAYLKTLESQPVKLTP